jgi:hypothetical protein
MRTFAGRDWYYNFREIDAAFAEATCAKVAARLLERYSKLTKAWSTELNSEWTCRLFMAAKLVMSSTLHVNSAHYAQDRNLRVVVPYLQYYSILSLLRAVCYTLPEHDWKDGQLIQISHGAAIDGALEHLRRFDKTVADAAEAEIRELKAERELISYRAPSSGDDQISEKNRFLSLCMLLAEVAQFNSELFEFSLLKHANPAHFRLLSEYAEKIASVEIDGHYFGDNEDAYRLGYLARKQPHPVNMQHFMKEGHVDDFFGAWVAKEDNDELFNPDDMQCIIFDIP